MIYIFLSGQIKNKRKLEQFCYDVLYDFCGNVAHDVDIEVRVKKDIGGQMGFCWGDHEHIVIELAKGNSVAGEYIEFGYNEVIVTLAHELVHAKQHILKEAVVDCEQEPYESQYKLVERFWNPHQFNTASV
jgi:hypothetical protein